MSICISFTSFTAFSSKLKIGITWLLEVLEMVLKKVKSSEFHPQNKSGPALKVWSHKGSNLYPKMAQKGKTRNGARDSKNFSEAKQKCF